MTSNFPPLEYDSYFYCRNYIKNGRDKLFSQKINPIRVISSPKN